MWKMIENLMDLVLRKLLHLKLTDKQWETLTQFVKFGIVGLSNTVISYLIYVGALIILEKNNIFPTIAVVY